MPFISYAQNFEDVTLWRALKDVTDGFFIDVGALDADLDSVTRAFSERGWCGINVEPVPALCERIARRDHAPGTIHFLKVDCEGGECDVLLGANFRTFRPWIILVEAAEPLAQTPSFDIWEPILLDAGYRFAWFDGLNRLCREREMRGPAASCGRSTKLF